jgi:heat shock protein HslJ
MNKSIPFALIGFTLFVLGGFLYFSNQTSHSKEMANDTGTSTTNGGQNTASTSEPDPIVVEDFEGEADPDRMTLTMTKWNWISALYTDGKKLTPKQQGKFTLTFSNNGTFSATTDCNSMGGKYKATKTDVTFSEIMSTLMYCEGSQESEFASILQNASHYHFTSRGELILGLKLDSGTATFR